MSKKIIAFFIALSATLVLFNGCAEDSSNPVTPPVKVGFVINTTPAGARVIINNIATSFFTPVTVDSLKANTTYNIGLALANYDTLKFAVTTGTGIDTLTKSLKGNTTLFGPVKIYEYYGTGTGQPSGLSLQYGKALSASSANKDTLDLYYYSSSSGGWVIKSANALTGVTRATFFKTGAALLLTDGVASPTKDASWFSTTPDRPSPNNYFFIYDQDGHYSKAKIVSFGGTGATGDPTWVEIQWYYNKVVGNKLF